MQRERHIFRVFKGLWNIKLSYCTGRKGKLIEEVKRIDPV
jgi:hypothetical protein